ncbi:MAG: aquaporin [Bacteroidota bacterium]
MKAYLAELIGTFFLVFCGTGAIIINDLTEETVGHLGVAITFGFIVTVMIYSLGFVSGAHINPAVSLAFAAVGKFKKQLLLGYVLAQLAGAVLASLTLFALFPEHDSLGMTLPAGNWQQSFILEIILSYLLMFVILFVSQNESVNQFTGIAVGMTVLLEALFAGPITGASMNPARSFAPAIVSGNLDLLWIYLIAPTVGTLLAGGTWVVFGRE